MLFMPMSAAAVRAARSASGESRALALAATAWSRAGLRAAIAEARAVPQVCCSLSSCCCRTLARLSFRSRAWSGRPARSSSSVIVIGSGGLQRVLALLPVAGAELVGLQRVEHAQDLLRVAADVQAVDRDELDDTVRVDQEGRAQ